MFCQSQAFATDKKPDFNGCNFGFFEARFYLAFFGKQKKPNALKKSQNFKTWLQKSQSGNPVRW